jgi:magnesium chelatase subunit D
MTMLPFSAVVGQDDAKLALLLAAIDPRLGGVLLRGQKGSAKTTLARGLAQLLPGDSPFVELPLGATEDRVLGSLDLTELVTTGTPRYRPGLLAAAHGGVLYVDEINLLADHLVDVLLDVAVTGVNRVERDGVSHTHPARFVLVASMNPEEGELRPQLLDRFGLAVDVVAPVDVTSRAAAVATQLGADAEPALVAPYVEADRDLRQRLAAVHPSTIPAPLIATASRLAVAVGAEGLRADLMLCRAAAAHAGWDGRAAATAQDVRRVAAIVLAHRRRRSPLDDPGLSEQDLADAFADADAPTADAPRDDVADPDPASDPPRLPSERNPAPAPGRQGRTLGARGRYVRDVPATEDTTTFAAVPTVIAAATRRAGPPGQPGQPDRSGPALAPEDLREAVREQPVGSLVVLVVDTSGSMGANRRIAAAKGVALSLLTDAYQRRNRVAVVTFRGDGAEVVLRPTGSVEIARARLAELATGGTTPLADGIDTALAVARAARTDDLEPLLVLITDGRATGGGDDPVSAAHGAAARVARARVPALVIDAEPDQARLGIAADLARVMHADCLPLAGLGDGEVERYLRDRGPGGPSTGSS